MLQKVSLDASLSMQRMNLVCRFPHGFDFSGYTNGVILFIDKRTSTWLKLKKDYVANVGDSFDLVPIGAWHGNGRKAQWWSPILLATWDQDSGTFVGVCKCMSGILPRNIYKNTSLKKV